jgi:uncharacterized protein YqiB (DUF1249 family)
MKNKNERYKEDLYKSLGIENNTEAKWYIESLAEIIDMCEGNFARLKKMLKIKNGKFAEMKKSRDYYMKKCNEYELKYVTIHSRGSK